MYTDVADVLPMHMLPAGAAAEVMEVTGEPAWVGRMAELGLGAGSRVRILQAGSPCLIEIGGSRLSLRGHCTMRVLVRPLPRVTH
jgi:ferrous iron transport protein A